MIRCVRNYLSVELKLTAIQEIELPESMLHLGLRSFTLSDGSKLDVKTFYRGNISEKNKKQAHDWLRDRGHGDLIKNLVVCSFGKGEDIRGAGNSVHGNYCCSKIIVPWKLLSISLTGYWTAISMDTNSHGQEFQWKLISKNKVTNRDPPPNPVPAASSIFYYLERFSPGQHRPA